MNLEGISVMNGFCDEVNREVLGWVTGLGLVIELMPRFGSKITVSMSSESVPYILP